VTSARTPEVSVALPVYNGERFVADAIDSILSQTFEDLELVISDNASTDGTEEICRAYARRDARVRYNRNPHNIGAAPNYRRALAMTQGRYVKLAAHDDVCLPRFAESCVDTLNQDPSVALAHTATSLIDAGGEVVKDFETEADLDSTDPVARFKAALGVGEGIFLFWGMARRETLDRLSPIGSFVGHDRTRITALALRGRIRVSDESLFQMREHPGRSIHVHDWRHPRDAISWYDPHRTGRLTFPNWRLLAEHSRGVIGAPISLSAKAACLLALGSWMNDNRQALRWDLGMAAARVPVIGDRTLRLFDRAAGVVRAEVSEGGSFVLVDDGTLETDIFGRRVAVPFVERNGTYWGPPRDEVEAVAELQRMKSDGAQLVIVASNCFWWLDHYAGLAKSLAEHPLIHAGRDFKIYDLRVSVRVNG
jgi:hypothetical protein